MNENENLDPIIPQEPVTSYGSSDDFRAASDLPSGEPVPEDALPEEPPVYTPPSTRRRLIRRLPMSLPGPPSRLSRPKRKSGRVWAWR